MCDPRHKYSDELPGCQLFFLTKSKSDCTLGLLPAGVNYTDTPPHVSLPKEYVLSLAKGTFCFPSGVRFVPTPITYKK